MNESIPEGAIRIQEARRLIELSGIGAHYGPLEKATLVAGILQAEAMDRLTAALERQSAGVSGGQSVSGPVWMIAEEMVRRDDHGVFSDLTVVDSCHGTFASHREAAEVAERRNDEELGKYDSFVRRAGVPEGYKSPLCVDDISTGERADAHVGAHSAVQVILR